MLLQMPERTMVSQVEIRPAKPKRNYELETRIGSRVRSI